jgi:small subunit ribosomal protein S4
LVNGKVVNIPSYQIQLDDVITVRDKAKSQLRIKAALALASQRAAVEWIDVDTEKLESVYKRHPDREELPAEINESFIVELYSK